MSSAPQIDSFRRASMSQEKPREIVLIGVARRGTRARAMIGVAKKRTRAESVIGAASDGTGARSMIGVTSQVTGGESITVARKRLASQKHAPSKNPLAP